MSSPLNATETAAASSGASQQQGRDPEFWVAVAAAILGGGAFIVSFAQALLQYLSSNNSRWKCTKSAIGSSNKYVRTSWSFRAWKIKVYYPMLAFDTASILREVVRSDLKKFRSNPQIQQIVEGRNDVRISFLSNQKVNTWHVADTWSAAMSRTSDKILSIGDLTMRDAIRFLRYRITHPLWELSRPRASWAQLLMALGIYDSGPLVLRRIDADTVHSNLDTPVQRVKLRELGRLAFALGFETVSIDMPNRVFSAYCPVASITTEEVPVLGKVLRFEGDIRQLQITIGRCSALWIFRAQQLVLGQVSFGGYYVHGLFWPLATISNCMLKGLKSAEYNQQEREVMKYDRRGFGGGPVLRESYMLKSIFLQCLQARLRARAPDASTVAGENGRPGHTTHQATDENIALRTLLVEDSPGKLGMTANDITACIAKFQGETGTRVPTLYAAATFMSIHGVVCGFPSRSMLYSILPWARRRARQFHSDPNKAYILSDPLADSLAVGSLKFAREDSKYLLSTADGIDSYGGVLGWGISNMKTIYDLMPEDLQRQLIPRPGVWKVNAVLMQETADLLRHFEVRKWANEVAEYGWATLGGFKVINLLWIQVVMIDIAIQFYLYGRWNFQPIQANKSTNGEKAGWLDLVYNEAWGTTEAAVVRSIVKAWRPHDTNAEYVVAGGRHEADVYTLNSDDTAAEDESGLESGDSSDESSSSGSEDESDASESEESAAAESSADESSDAESSDSDSAPRNKKKAKKPAAAAGKKAKAKKSDEEATASGANDEAAQSSEKTKTEEKETAEKKKHKWRRGKGKDKEKAAAADAEGESAREKKEKASAGRESSPELTKKESSRAGTGFGAGRGHSSTPHTSKSGAAGRHQQQRRGGKRSSSKAGPGGKSSSGLGGGAKGMGGPNNAPTFGPDDWDALPAQFEDWNLAKHLEKNRDVLPGPRDRKKRAKCQRLADLLELRAIFVIAFLFMHPDSSDVYLTEGDDVEMPMA